MIQVTCVGAVPTDVKKQFYRRIADEVHEKAGVRKEDVWISLVDSGWEDWSFGNGDMQYAPNKAKPTLLFERSPNDYLRTDRLSRSRRTRLPRSCSTISTAGLSPSAG